MYTAVITESALREWSLIWRLWPERDKTDNISGQDISGKKIILIIGLLSEACADMNEAHLMYNTVFHIVRQ